MIKIAVLIANVYNKERNIAGHMSFHVTKALHMQRFVLHMLIFVYCIQKSLYTEIDIHYSISFIQPRSKVI